MHGQWLQKKNNAGCILFMAGWGMGPEPFFSCVPNECDLFICYDYRELSLPDMDQFANYSHLELISWSMGVWVAAHLFSGLETMFSRAIALGGTLHPIDDNLGIPVAAFDATITELDAPRLDAFYASMFDNPAQAKTFMSNRPRRSVSSVQEELISLKQSIGRAGAVQDIFSLPIVTMRDRIFPARNQLRAWGKEKSEKKKWPHFPFYQDAFWQAAREGE